MDNTKVYWTTKDGQQIDVDEMDVQHLRNVLKMLLRKQQQLQLAKTQSSIVDVFYLKPMTQQKWDEQENLWK
jgi:hypothetical protein